MKLGQKEMARLSHLFVPLKATSYNADFSHACLKFMESRETKKFKLFKYAFPLFENFAGPPPTLSRKANTSNVIFMRESFIYGCVKIIDVYA